jgi:hypothetical protein
MLAERSKKREVVQKGAVFLLGAITVRENALITLSHMAYWAHPRLAQLTCGRSRSSTKNSQANRWWPVPSPAGCVRIAVTGSLVEPALLEAPLRADVTAA